MPSAGTIPGFLDTVLAVIDERGPSSAGEIEKALEAPGRGISGWWEWSITKTACEYLFAIGAIGVAYRRGFERCYDLMDRVLPRLGHGGADPRGRRREAGVAGAGRPGARHRHGGGPGRLLPDQADHRAGRARRARRGGRGRSGPGPRAGRRSAYLHRDARIPRKVSGAALLCPFDPLIWERDRTERLFDFHYRIEIYTPLAKRQFGYYVFPLLVGEQLVGRFDLKADRLGSRLLVQASWVEAGRGCRRSRRTPPRSSWPGWPAGWG